MLKYRRLWRLEIRSIVLGLHHQIYPNGFVNSSLLWDGLQLTLMELGRMTMGIFMIFYSEMLILKNGANTNMIRMLPMHAYPFGNIGFRFMKKISVRSFFIGRVVGIQSNEKRKCKFDEDGDIHNYTLDQLQAYSINHTYVYNDNDEEISSNNVRDDSDEGNGDNNNNANEPTEKKQEADGGGDSGVDSDTE